MSNHPFPQSRPAPDPAHLNAISPRSASVHRLWNICPWTDYVSDYDLENLDIYALLLDAETDGGSESEMARVFFRINPRKEPLRAEVVVDSHLRRARWMLENGFPLLSW